MTTIDAPVADLRSLRVVATQLRTAIMALAGDRALPAIPLPFADVLALGVVLYRQKMVLEMLLGRRGGAVSPLAVADTFAAIPLPMADLASLQVTASVLREVVLALAAPAGA